MRYRAQLLLGGALALMVVLARPGSAQAPDAWSVEHYTELSARMYEADQRQAAAEVGSVDWVAAGRDALAAREVLLAWVTSVLENGSVPGELVSDAVRAQFLLLQNIVVLSAEQGECAGLEERAESLELPTDDDQALAAARDRALDLARSCEPREAVAGNPSGEEPDTSEVSGTPEEMAVVDEPVVVPVTSPEEHASDSAQHVAGAAPDVRRSPRRRAGWSLIGLGAGATAAGWGWDAASASGPRREFRTLSSACETGASCDMERLRALRSQINASRAPIVSMVAGGAVMAVAGATLLVADRRGERTAGRPRLVVEPGTAAAWSGATLQVHW